MTKRDEAFRSMVEKVLLTLKESLSIWQDNKSIEGAVTIIRTYLDDIDKNWEIQRNVTTGLGTIKKQNRAKLDQSTYIMFGIIRAYALSINDQKLYDEYSSSITKIKDVKDTEMGAFAKMTISTIDKYKDELMQHGLTKEMIETYGKEADGFINSMAAPDEAIAKQRVATKNISDLIKKIRTVLDKELDTFMIPYMLTNPDFYNTYVYARIIFDNPESRYSLVGIVCDKETGLPLQYVKVIVRFDTGSEITEYKKTTSKNGIFIFKKLPQGICKVIFEKSYYDILTIDSEIHDNDMTRLNVAIRKAE